MNRARTPFHSRRGFTLIELIVASIVAAILAGAVTTSVSMFLRSKSSSESRQVAFARADAAAARMALEVASAVRDGELGNGRIRITDGGSDASPRDELLVIADLSRPVRDPEESPEGGDYESQYRVMPSEGGDALWRRVDHAFDDNLEGGGIASPFVPRIQGLSVEATDGADWYQNWDSDSDGYPHAVRITVIAASDDGGAVATARRVVAIDRVPVPATEPETDGAPVEAPATGNTRPSQPATGTVPGSTGGGGFSRETPAPGGTRTPPAPTGPARPNPVPPSTTPPPAGPAGGPR